MGTDNVNDIKINLNFKWNTFIHQKSFLVGFIMDQLGSYYYDTENKTQKQISQI